MTPSKTPPRARTIAPIPFEAHKVGTLSAELLERLHVDDHGGAVRRLNLLEAHLASLEEGFGFDARSLDGGVLAWRAMGYDTSEIDG